MKSYIADFPILAQEGLTYLDSAATSLKPHVVIDAMNDYYTSYSANIHRGLYPLSEKASIEFESTRDVIANYIHANSPDEIIFTRNTTESINLIVYSLGRNIIQQRDEIVTTVMEHHSNFVPWQQLAFASGADFKVIDCDDNGKLRLYDNKGAIDLTGVITNKTKIFAIQYVSNVLGTIHPLKEVIAAARKINPHIYVVVDAAQAVPHIAVNVDDLDCDFLAFSAHKMCGPTGAGVLWGKKKHLESMQPFMYGGDMIDEVFIDRTTYAKVPHIFEAGTPDISAVIGMKAAVEYIQSMDLESLLKHEVMLSQMFISHIQDALGDAFEMLGTFNNDKHTVGVVPFNLKGCHPHDIAGSLAEDGIAIRAGNHCAMPLHTRLGVTGSNRVSFYMYNTEDDVEKCVKSLQHAYKLLT